ncbi:M20/M25/M40 family metallo-hydrolase [Novosphingobium sp. 1949]|uniref:M20/M25/M40 family metallo-hydrolase n=1 Tax=Novosphingobium organovorum TaxID=2930092 RepID=A0ABT0BHR4_9SPHN|nr:M20/M25/M40 family metallo-hydrolase [Novosphingobium organovorum]MCJ2184577.1 M20/M25/M40 family metallo-hydrolase [Novosphingobium organovorum]
MPFKMPSLTVLLAAPLALGPLSPALAADETPATPGGQEALAVLTEAVAVPTVEGRGQVPVLADKLARRLIAAGFAPSDVQFTPVGETGYLIARYPGRDRKALPTLVIAHMDVVEAKPADWERDPFTPVIEDGYLFGRGALDNKGDLAMVMAAVMGLHRAGWVPAHDLILAFSGDEETQMATTAAMAKALGKADLVLNADAGAGTLDASGKPFVYEVQAGEKTYGDYTLTISDPGGHSSRPGKTNAIAAMSAAMEKIWAYHFPVQVSPLTKAYLEGSAASAPAEVAGAMRALAANPTDAEAAATLSARPEYVGVIRTTCVPTMIAGGHAPNALPQSVSANVNCRIFPGTSRAAVLDRLTKVVDNPAIHIAFTENGTLESIESPLRKDVLHAVEIAVHQRSPGLTIVPGMSAGATDSMHFRSRGIPAFGISATYMRAQDEFAHGLNERLPLATLDPGVKQWQTVLTTLLK